jgi:hypothetical protein
VLSAVDPYTNSVGFVNTARAADFDIVAAGDIDQAKAAPKAQVPEAVPMPMLLLPVVVLTSALLPSATFDPPVVFL